jgi:OmpA-OmpF porin, OOP family
VTNLVQTVLGAVTPDLNDRLASVLGESPGATSKGLSAAVPALLAGALQQSSTPTGADGLVGAISQATAGGNPLDQVVGLTADDSARAGLLSQGRGLADGLLGTNSGSVANSLASFAGLKGGSATQLLALAAPLVLGAIAKALGGAPTAGGVRSLLSDQRASILGALPPGLGSLFGFGGTAQGAASTAGAAGGGFRKILPWLIAGVVILGLILALRNCGSRGVETPPPTAEVTAPPAATAAPAAPGPVAAAPETLSLPNGQTISVAPGSIGHALARYLESNEPTPKVFIFDNLNFDTASNALTPESKPTVDTLVVILRAYPGVNGRIVGYTDNQGDPAANKTLSEARAATVAREIVAAGIPAQRLETAGMGEADPIADNATEQGRAQNRRTELVIIKK